MKAPVPDKAVMASCTYCSLPVRLKDASRESEALYCCLGCAMAHRMTDGDGRPGEAVRQWWSLLLILAFLFFNQAFFLLLSLAFRQEGFDPMTHWTLWASQGIGLLFLGLLWWKNRGYASQRQIWLRILFLGGGLTVVMGVIAERTDLAAAGLLGVSALTGWVMTRGWIVRQQNQTPNGVR